MQEMNVEKFGVFSTIKAYFFLLGKDKNKFIFWGTLLLISELMLLSEAYFFAKFVDYFTIYSKGDSLYPFYLYTGIIFVTYLIASQMRLTAKRKLGIIGINASYRVKVSGFQKLLDFSIQWHDKEQSGNKVQRIQTGASAITKIRSLFSNHYVQVIAGVIGILGFFILVDITFFLFLIVFVILFFSIERYFNIRLSKIFDKRNKAIEDASGTMYEGASNITTIKSLGAKSSLSKSVNSKENIQREFDEKATHLSIFKWKFFQGLTALATGLFLLIVGFKTINGVITVGLIILYYTYFHRIIRLSMSFSSSINQTLEQVSALKRLVPIFTEESADWFGDETFPKKWTSISFSNVVFSYEKGTNHLRNISFDIVKNQKIGVVGKSGSGKSTLAKIFMGLYRIKSGSIALGKKNYYDVSHDAITDNVVIVLQDSELFNMSIKDNITMLKPFNSALFKQAISIAQLDLVIKKLPEGMETLIGEKGYKLSGGERQRLGIARAIYKNTPIIVLDEATSSLDTTTEKKIQHALEKLDKTMIIIAHRLSTLTGVDKIIVFDKGKIIEEGKYGALARKRTSAFYQLLKQQKTKK